jgi:hypothetical protein
MLQGSSNAVTALHIVSGAHELASRGSVHSLASDGLKHGLECT